MKAVLAAALVNFLWQGAAIGALAWLGFAIARTPRVRYLVGVLALAVMAAAPIATGAAVVGAGNVPRPLSNVQGPLPSQVEIGTRFLPVSPEGRTETSPDLFQPDPRFASVVLAVWLLGVATLSLRLTLGWLGVRRLTRRVTEAGANVQAVAHRLAVALNIRARVRIVESALVKVPAVIGAFKPVVLLPAAAMSGLSMAQVEALVAHELAHVRRHDYLVNLLQSAVETLLFYHPAVWLVSRRIRQDRELCCDDLALVVCGDRVAYASALADLESLRAMPSPALAANGGSLVARIRRILGVDDGAPLANRGRSIAGLVILASIVLLAATQAARVRAMPTIDEMASEIAPPGMEVFEAEPAPKQPSGRAERFPAPPQVQGVLGGVVGGVTSGVPGGVVQGVVGGVPQAPESQGRSAEYLIQVGDQIRVTVASPIPQPVYARQPYTVQSSGGILLPGFSQELRVAGLTVVQARQLIRQALMEARQFENPIVDVSIEGHRANAETEVAAEAPQTAGATISVGQIVRLEVTVGKVRQAEFNKDYTVQPDGTILIPYLGAVKASGQTTKELGAQLAGSLNSSGTLPGATVAVAIETRNAAQAPLKVATVNVQGAIRNPGRIPLREDRATLTDAIAGAGGLSANAGARIILRRAGAPDVSYSKANLLGGRLVDAALKDGDTITVEVAPHFYVTGYVNNLTSEYNWEEGMTLQKALAMAGGVSSQGALNRVAISRRDPKTGGFSNAKLDKDKMNTPILPDDVIKVPVKRL